MSGRWLLPLACCLLTWGCGDDDDDSSGAADGAPCVLATDCASGQCLALAEGLHCGRTCADAAECGAGQACGLAVVGDDAAGVCGPSGPGAAGAACAADADCASRLCDESLCLSPCEAACVTECVTTTLTRDGHDADREVCPPPAPAPDLVLGPLSTGADGHSDEATFEVPAGVSAFTIAVVDDDGLRVAVAQLTAPDGTVVADADGDPAGLQRVNHYIGAAAILVPATDDAAALVRAGTYRLVVGTYDPTVFDALVPMAGAVERVEIVFSREGTQGGVLDLELHWAPALGVAAADAPTHPFTTDLLATMQALLAPAGVHLGRIEHHDLSADADTVEDGNEARALCKSVSQPGPHHRAVNILLVRDLSFTTGFSGGIPGPTGLTGTNASGIVAEALGSGRDTGILLAHETGHFIGLRHTTEIGGGTDDVSDTPECPGGTEISQCPDYRNLMFPIFPLSEGLALTAGQVEIARGSPMLFEVRADATCPTAPFVDDITETRWASGDTTRLPSAFAGTCGGADAPESVHLLRVLRDDLASLTVRVTAAGFAPTVHVRRGPDCADETTEIGCATGTAGAEVVVAIDPPAPGPYFVFVDGTPGGAYVLAVDET